MKSKDFLIKVKIAMLINKISLKELAKRTNINLRTLSRRFANPNNFTLEELIKIAKELNINTNNSYLSKEINLVEKDLDKLDKYNEIEQKIGCPLEVYFKMCVFGTTLHSTRSGHPEVTQDFNIYTYSQIHKCFCLKILGQITPMYYAKDYGKIWAFTEEELKNENSN